MNINKPIIAICYDFDGTLCKGNMQEYGFFTDLGEKAESFWKDSNKKAEENNADPILAYMNHMIEAANIGSLKTTRDAFKEHGKSIKLFDGVSDWFDRVNDYADQCNITVEHYIVSSGLKEMIEGTELADKFKKIYACSFIYDANDAAKWPAVAVNYTTKTQFLFRINKGIENDNDNKQINAFIAKDERRIPFDRMIYVGDGTTDIPCMKLVKDKGGNSIGVYDPKSREKETETNKLLSDGRVNFVSEADYTQDSHMEKLVFAIIDKIMATFHLTSFAK